MEVREDTTGKFKLRDYVILTAWHTTQAHDPNPRSEGQKAKHGTKHGCGDLNRDAALCVPGPATPSSCVQTAKREGLRLNPRFSLWLMGFPAEWVSYGVPETPSSRKSPRSS